MKESRSRSLVQGLVIQMRPTKVAPCSSWRLLFRDCIEWFAHMVSLSFPSSSVSLPHFTDEEVHPERLSNLPQVTQLRWGSERPSLLDLRGLSESKPVPLSQWKPAFHIAVLNKWQGCWLWLPPIPLQQALGTPLWSQRPLWG
jgi:hypothetical protein